jgi:hypothetical protein
MRRRAARSPTDMPIAKSRGGLSGYGPAFVFPRVGGLARSPVGPPRAGQCAEWRACSMAATAARGSSTSMTSRR